MSSLRIEYPLSGMSREEAKERLSALGDYFTNKHGLTVSWDGDRAAVRGKYMVVAIEGTMGLDGERATFEGKDPGFLWRNKAREYLENKLRTYLDPGRPVDALPRR